VTVVGALRVGASDQARRGIDVGSVGTPTVGAVAPVGDSHRVVPRHPSTAKPAPKGHPSHATTTPRKPAAAPVPPVASTHTETFTSRKPAKPVSRPSTPSNPDPGAGVVSRDYKVSGSIEPTGPVAIANQVRVNYGTSAVTSVSQLNAPVGDSQFTLDQALVSPPQSAPTMQLQPHVVMPSGQAIALPVATSATTVALDASTVTYNVDVNATMAVGTTADAPATLAAHITYDAAMRHILAESVIVTGLSVTEPPTVPVATSPSPSVTSAQSVPDAPVSPTGQTALPSETTGVRTDDSAPGPSS
jgi:hypothetical protein